MKIGKLITYQINIDLVPPYNKVFSKKTGIEIPKLYELHDLTFMKIYTRIMDFYKYETW